MPKLAASRKLKKLRPLAWLPKRLKPSVERKKRRPKLLVLPKKGHLLNKKDLKTRLLPRKLALKRKKLTEKQNVFILRKKELPEKQMKPPKLKPRG